MTIELELLVACVAEATGASPDGRIAGALKAGVDWPILRALARRHSVFPQLHAALGSRRGDVPAAVMPEIDADAVAMASEALALSGVMCEVVAALEARGVACLPFKGPTLAVQAYGHLGGRAYGDVDLLVRPARLREAREILLGRGFREQYPLTEPRRSLLLRRGSHESFIRADRIVELHWRFASSVSDFGMDYETVWSALTPVAVGGIDVPALDIPEGLVVLSLHGAKHAWVRLGWIADIAALLDRHRDADWARAIDWARALGCERMVRLAVRLAVDVLRADAPRVLRDFAGSDPAVGGLVSDIRRLLEQPESSGAGTLAVHWAMRESWRRRAGMAAGALVALNQTDLQWVRLPDALASLYYVTRPLRLVTKGIAHVLE